VGKARSVGKLQYRESPDGGTRHRHGPRDKLLEGWTLHDGPVPGPDFAEIEIDELLKAEIVADLARSPAYAVRRQEIAEEVRQRGKS